MASEPHCTWPWRVGRHVGRTIYAMPSGQATDSDALIGIMDTPALAAEAVAAHNARRGGDAVAPHTRTRTREAGS